MARTPSPKKMMARTPGQQQGRTRTTGSGKAPKQFKRVAVSFRHKLNVIEFYDAVVTKDKMHSTINYFYPSISTDQTKTKKRQVYNWLKQRALIIDKCETGCASHCKDRSIGMSTTLSPYFEEQLVIWINSLRREGVPVTGTMVRIYARDCYETAGLPEAKFSASHTRLLSFLRRNRLSIRRRTRQSQKTPEDAADRAKMFGKEVQDKMKELGVDRVYNAGQTAINYEYLPAKTVGATGEKTIWMKSAGKDKDRVTLMLLGDSYGTKYDPFMIFKTKPLKIEERARENTAFQHGFGSQLWRELKGEQIGVQVYGNNAGWWTSALTIQFLIYHFLDRPDMHVPILLLLDEFSGHWRKDVLIFARLLNIELMPIPAGYTFSCQPADIAWNKPLKDAMRKNWVDYMLLQLQSSRTIVPFKLKPPTRHQLIDWTKAAWKSLPAAVIANGFRKAMIIPKQTNVTPVHEDEQTLHNPEPDWELFNSLLEQIPVVRHVVDPSRDIETLATEDLGING